MPRFAAPPYVDLVRAAAKAVDAAGPRQLADALGYTGRDEDKAVRNWWNGTNAPSYEGTMRLLAAAGWLNIDGDTAAPLTRREEERRSRLLAEAESALQRLREELA